MTNQNVPEQIKLREKELKVRAEQRREIYRGVTIAGAYLWTACAGLSKGIAMAQHKELSDLVNLSLIFNPILTGFAATTFKERDYSCSIIPPALDDLAITAGNTVIATFVEGISMAGGYLAGRIV